MKEIIIKQSESNSKEYEARFQDEFLQATFCIIFKDNIYGAVGLNRFAEMIKTFYEVKRIPLSLDIGKSKIESGALINLMTKMEVIQ